MKITFEKFKETITELTDKVGQMAKESCTNTLSNNYAYILSEIELNPPGNFHDQRERRIKENNKKESLSVDKVCLILFEQYDKLYDINVFIHFSKKNQTIIDIQYLLKDKLKAIQQPIGKDIPPMFHAKLAIPSFHRNKQEKFNVNWEHQKLMNR